MRLQNRVAMVTGGGAGIGRAICRRLAAEGAKVMVAEVDCDSGRETAKLIQDVGGIAQFVRTDVRDEDSIRDCVAATVTAYGMLDTLVNNAAAFLLRDVNATAEDWDVMLHTNVRGAAFCAKHAVPEMKKAGGGAIVNIGSISSTLGQAGMVTYNTTKGAILTMTKCMAMDLGPSRIRVNCLCPGNIKTRALISSIEAGGQSYEEGARELIPLNFLGRIGDPEEVASCAAFLVSDDASYVTGAALFVDGGYSAH